MLATRGSGKVIKMEALINNKAKSMRCLEHMLLGQTTRRNMLELYLCVTSESFTTLAYVRQGVTTASGGVTKQEIVGSQARRQNQGP